MVKMPNAAQARELRQQFRERRHAARGLRAHQRVDDAAIEYRLGEQRDGEQHIGEGEQHAQPTLRTERGEDAGINAQEIHRDPER
jgi:hypothetical protein